jgi:hypothetical protein
MIETGNIVGNVNVNTNTTPISKKVAFESRPTDLYVLNIK